jgi:gliding motility-associated-like protein
MLKNSILFIIFLFGCAFQSFATHNRAGEIHVEQINGCGALTVRAKVITWTRTSSTNADRDTVIICWGDGVCESVVRSNGGGNGVILPDDIKYNEYVAVHTYAGPASYKISMTDKNRIANIININPSSSDNVPFHIETTYSFQDPQFGGCNTTPYLLQPPVDVACVGQPFKHNPNAFDPDGDSISYELIVPLSELNTNVPLYSYPNQVNPGVDNTLQLNPITGDLLWLSPQLSGDYNLAMIIISWRNGIAIDTTIRDMQVRVENCNNNPPEVKSIQKICVIAGQNIEFNVTGNDPDTNNLVQLTALGGPLNHPYSPAVFTVPNGYNLPIVNGKFKWQTTCEHISDQEYSMVFKAVDTISPSVPQLADLKTVQIKVVGPPPLNVQANAEPEYAEITWEKPYQCEAAADDYFYGFSVWRKQGSNPFPLDTCAPGLAGKGYTELIYFTKQVQNGRYYFRDTTVERGRTYCYRVIGKFARRSTGGYPYNLVESLASEEVCIQLPRDLPLITNVSIQKTDVNNGEIKVCWSKPNAADLDTLLNSGPYRYQVKRSTGFNGANLQAIPNGSFTSTYFADANDTCFIDTNLNTENEVYSYEISFFVKGQSTELGKTNIASSVYLNVNSTDQMNVLSWEANVPWGNYRHVILRKNDQTLEFDSIGTSLTPKYEDKNLQNGKKYCYIVRTIGTYSIGGIIDPIFNLSQENCGIPLDTVPPCAPELTVNNLCTTGQTNLPNPPFENTLLWTNPNNFCPNTNDVVSYNLYFSPNNSDPTTLLESLNGANNTGFIHQLNDGLVGCYTVTAVDSLGNESEKSALVCADNCPEYKLPNSFTPNGDGNNELFTPFAGWRFVDHVEMQVFNRWGNLVFETDKPEIAWDGKNNQGKEVSEGTYFYLCKVFERRVEGIVLSGDILKGYIELIR